MVLILDPSRVSELSSQEFVVGGKEKKVEVNLSNGIPIVLTEEQKNIIVLTKYVSTDPIHADWQPSGEWFEQVTTDVGGGRRRPRILVSRDDGSSSGVNTDDGLIIDLVGTMTRVVGILPGRPPMSEDEVDSFVEATEEPVPLFQQWDFRVSRVLKTDGPIARFNLTKSEDQKRIQSQADMFDAIKRAFSLSIDGPRVPGAIESVLASQEGQKRSK